MPKWVSFSHTTSFYEVAFQNRISEWGDIVRKIKTAHKGINRETFLLELHHLFSGSHEGRSPNVSLYEGQTTRMGLKIARDHLRLAKKLMREARSDFDYWTYAGDEALASVLLAFFRTQKKSMRNLPPLPNHLRFDHLCLDSKLSHLLEWTRYVNLVLDGHHVPKGLQQKVTSIGAPVPAKPSLPISPYPLDKKVGGMGDNKTLVLRSVLGIVGDKHFYSSLSSLRFEFPPIHVDWLSLTGDGRWLVPIPRNYSNPFGE